MSVSSRPSSPVAPGDLLASKYRVERVLGEGGMGVVVAATHELLGQSVALKFLLPAAAEVEGVAERFLREARASVRFRGQHVAKTLDVGTLDDGRPFMVMELLEGHDLAQELDRTGAALPVARAVEFVLQACEGVAEAHARGIVHRDLKPANLFLTRGVDGHPLIKVLDFGISKSLDDGDAGLSLTRTGMQFGSPLYMSPEQMRSAKHAEARSDIWALGVILYELLSARTPFDGGSMMELCMAVAEQSPTPLRALRADIPEALDQAVLRCLSKRPDDRFASVAQLAAALEPFGGPRARGAAERIGEVLEASTSIGSGQRVVLPSPPKERSSEALQAWAETGPPASTTASGARPTGTAARHNKSLYWAGAALLSLGVVVWALWPASRRISSVEPPVAVVGAGPRDTPPLPVSVAPESPPVAESDAAVEPTLAASGSRPLKPVTSSKPTAGNPVAPSPSAAPSAPPKTDGFIRDRE